MTLVGMVGGHRVPEAWEARKLVVVRCVRACLRSELGLIAWRQYCHRKPENQNC